jgi:hypothetical protein
VLDESSLAHLRDRLLAFKSERLNARQLTVSMISCSTAIEFCKIWHRQGYVRGASIAYGLFNGLTLVAVAVFGKPRFTKQRSNEVLELLRACSSANIRGGVGKLFSAFIKGAHCDKVISYADLLWGAGRVYEAIGFKEDGITSPGYLWVSPTKIYTRYETQKHKLHKLNDVSFDKSLTESEMMTAAGFYKVYDAGNVRYVWNRSKPKMLSQLM